jgi:HNH endonuclease
MVAEGRRSRMKKSVSHLDRFFLPPETFPQPDLPNREEWLEEQTENFVGTPTNTLYYRVFLELLWPPDHGIPGRIVSQDEVRDAINSFRLQQVQDKWEEKKHKWLQSGMRGTKPTEPRPPKPYIDPFRRLRELQGEEGFLGLVKEGNRAQLQNLDVSPKRIPRKKLSQDDWAMVLQRYSGRCANCGRKPPTVTLEQDHKIPRGRGGDNELGNWQPLCTECNNFKSTACRDCDLDCNKCPWAFPEKYSPPRIEPDLWQELRELAQENDLEPNELLNQVIKRGIRGVE